MSATVHRYPLQLIARQSIAVRGFVRVQRVGLDPRWRICLWVETDDGQERVIDVEIARAGDAHDPACYVGSVCYNRESWRVYCRADQSEKQPVFLTAPS